MHISRFGFDVCDTSPSLELARDNGISALLSTKSLCTFLMFWCVFDVCDVGQRIGLVRVNYISEFRSWRSPCTLSHVAIRRMRCKSIVRVWRASAVCVHFWTRVTLCTFLTSGSTRAMEVGCSSLVHISGCNAPSTFSCGSRHVQRRSVVLGGRASNDISIFLALGDVARSFRCVCVCVNTHTLLTSDRVLLRTSIVFSFDRSFEFAHVEWYLHVFHRGDLHRFLVLFSTCVM
jgi:hypothetical protein